MVMPKQHPHVDPAAPGRPPRAAGLHGRPRRRLPAWRSPPSRSSRACSPGPTGRWSQGANGQVVGSKLIGQSFTDAQGQPAAAVLPEPPVGCDSERRHRLRPHRDRRQQPRAGGCRRHARQPGHQERDESSPSLLTQVCSRSLAIGKLYGVDGSRPVLHAVRRGCGARRLPRRPGSRARSTRVVSVNEECPAKTVPRDVRRRSGAMHRYGDDVATGEQVVIRGNAPADPRCRRTP